ncbi:Crp/Fnr family transcriptional regulator [Chitinophaga sp. Cy-1792]|uniref:Crp/Fnr family transcriptional regulator n=1 Tax=Chitinophaga sp. Cy-1792 TaxID=2608339 RepID=UPI00141F0144|nr:Crp/Fnr family transcriptional regulator [Chitinophaga sp. Cy-1792]NIG55575.1 Crp/Fnr family transcriptional regulator [Chitinophaga sp. Cy-1792]
MNTRVAKFQQQFQALATTQRRLEVPAKTILLQEGQVSHKYFFIEKGAIRVWFNNKGRDITFQFFFEGEGLASAESFRKGTPSKVTIETLEPSVIRVLHKEDYQRVMQELGNDPAFLREMMDVMFERQLNYMNHFMSFIRDTPKERYLNLLHENPALLQRVPQHYIASYLGITSVSLSRIRNSILRQKK